MQIKTSILLEIAFVATAAVCAGCVSCWMEGKTGTVPICTIRHMSETLQNGGDDFMAERMVETFSGSDEVVAAPFGWYVDSMDEMMASDDMGYQKDAMVVLKMIRHPASVAMADETCKELIREKTTKWVGAGLEHYCADVRNCSAAVLNVLPRDEMDAIVSYAKGNGVSLVQEFEKCKVCDNGKVTKEVDLGACPACGGVAVRAEKYRRIFTEDLCKMCQGNGRRSGRLVAVCEHCQGNWKQCPTVKFPRVETPE